MSINSLQNHFSMAGEEQEIREALELIIRNKIPLTASWFTVKSVEEDSCTITIDEDENLHVEGIVLGFENGDVRCIPKVGSRVLVLFTDGSRTNGTVVKCDETDRLIFTPESLVLIGENFRGIVKVEPLVDKINVLENHVNDIKLAISAILNAASIASATPVTNAVLASYFTNFNILPIVDTLVSELENEKIKHGILT